jgi:uncharacterized membrane protein
MSEIIHEVKRNPWKLGVIYVDSADRRVIVRQRSGLGWTLNFGQPIAWVVLAAIIGLAILIRQRPGERSG